LMSGNSNKNRIALVTGTGHGLGRAMALELAKTGAHVIALSRKKRSLEELDDEIRENGGNVTLVPLDLRKMDGLDELGLAIYERWKRLDILVGNAGVLGPLTPTPHIKPDQWTEAMEVNVSANYRLIRSMDSLLRSAPAGRALFITSSVTQGTPRAYWGAYATTKAALEMLVQTYAQETLKTDLKVNLLNPGAMRTKMRAEAYPGDDPATLAQPSDIAKKALKLLSANFTETGKRFDIADL